MFTGKTSAVCATAGINSTRNVSADADSAALQNSVQKSRDGHQTTQQTYDACSSYGQSVSGSQQKLCSASNNFSNIFQTADLELTDADLEFDLK